jgi:hypothetical protein
MIFFSLLLSKQIKPKQYLNSKINRYNIYKLDINIKVFFQHMQALVWATGDESGLTPLGFGFDTDWNHAKLCGFYLYK